MTTIPLSLAEVTPEYITDAFRSAGLLPKDAGEVVGIQSRVIGEGAGFMGEVVDMRLQFSGSGEQTPASMILKVPVANDNRKVGQTLGVYEREIRFYQELQRHVGVRTPAHYFSAMDMGGDPAQALKAIKLMNKLPLWLIRAVMPLANWANGRKTSRYVLMIENLTGYRVGDQVGGCTTDEAKMALDAMARMHARFWNSDELAAYPWLIPMEYAAKPMQMMYLQALKPFKECHAATLRARDMEWVDWLGKRFFDVAAALESRPSTLVHGDFRLDNLCFDDETGEIILFDWQTLGIGAAVTDLSYFLSAMDVDVSDDEIEELIEYYRNRLAERGIDVPSEELHHDYYLGLLGVLNRLVPARFQDMLDLSGERGDALIDTWLRRTLRRLDRVGPDSLLNG